VNALVGVLEVLDPHHVALELFRVLEAQRDPELHRRDASPQPLGETDRRDLPGLGADDASVHEPTLLLRARPVPA